MRVPGFLCVLSLLVAGACRHAVPPAASRYITTAEPIDVGADPPLCLAVEPGNPQGVWWWQPGPSGCATRSTGPGVFPAQDAVVSSSAGAIDVQFRLQLHVGSPADVHIVVRDDVWSTAAGVRVPTARRDDLDIPERYSSRNTTAGSRREARWAGTKAAARPIVARTTQAATSVNVSLGWRPYSSDSA